MPACGQRARFRLAVADDATDEQVRVVERRSVSMGKRVAQFPAFVNRSRGFRGRMAGNSARKRELGEQSFHPVFILGDVGINLAVGALQVRVRHEGWPTVTGTGDVDHALVVLPNDAIEMDVDEVQSRRGAPVAQQPRFDVLEQQRFLQEWIVKQIDLADGEVIGRAPVSIHFPQQFRSQGCGHDVLPKRVTVSFSATPKPKSGR